jgi:hypothetical protein
LDHSYNTAYSCFWGSYTSNLKNLVKTASQDWVFEGVRPHLTPFMTHSLGRPLMLEEITAALGAMALAKSLSPNGVVNELYKLLWPTLKTEFLAMILAAVEKGALPAGVNEGLIVLLHKGGGRNTLNNWRPTTVSNVSYKIFAKALQMRLQPILMEIISLDQSAFLPMRYILDNIFLTQETISYAKESSQPLLFLKLDFSKAYDKVDLRFFFQALQHLGFPDTFIDMAHLLFRVAAARISMNGKSTSSFPILQGVRQGCPLAPYLFLIVGEILNHNMKREV